MSPAGIALYCARALGFAAVVCGVWMLTMRLRGRKIRMHTFWAVAYLSALVEITVIRGGASLSALREGGRIAPQLIPLHTMIEEWRAGVWPMLYHTLGNLAWFVPMGLLCVRKRLWVALGLGAAASAGIEMMQYLLASGTPDVDDIILNALGAALGWAMGRAFQWICGRSGRKAQET